MFLPDADNVKCDAFVDSIVIDKSMVESLRAEGFREISADNEKRDCKPSLHRKPYLKK
jgi:hypothetical protein